MSRGGRSLILACDFDRTLTGEDLLPNESATKAIAELKLSVGFFFILVSGRRLAELLGVGSLRKLCDLYVAENGAVIYDARRGDRRILGRRHERLEAALSEAGIEAEYGNVIVSVKRSEYERLVSALEKYDVEAEVIFNRDSAMILPRGVDKGSGLRKAVEALGLDDPYIVAFGDGENDSDLFKAADLRIAVSNAADEIKKEADIVSDLPDGDAVVDYLLKNVKCG